MTRPLRVLVPLLPHFLFAVALLAAPLAASAQDWTGRGRMPIAVRDQAGEPVAGAVVTARRADQPDAGPEPGVTNDRGKVVFAGLRHGQWQVTVEADGYLTAEGTVPIDEYGSNPERVIVVSEVPEAARAAEKAATVRGLLERGNELLGVGKVAEARAEYEKALAELPEAERPPVLRGIARTWYEEKKVDQTIDTLEQALAIAPDDAETLQLLVNVLVAEGRGEEAEPYLARLPQGAAVDPDALLNLGIEAYNAGELDDALQYFDRAARENPDYADVYYYRGLTHLNKGDNADARADFEKLLALAPEHPRAAEVRDFLAYLAETP